MKLSNSPRQIINITIYETCGSKKSWVVTWFFVGILQIFMIFNWFLSTGFFLQSVGTLLFFFIILICDDFCVLSIIIAFPQDQANSCLLYTMSELYPSMKSIPALTLSSAQVSSWPLPMLARCNYYYNMRPVTMEALLLLSSIFRLMEPSTCWSIPSSCGTSTRSMRRNYINLDIAHFTCINNKEDSQLRWKLKSLLLYSYFIT